MQKPLENYKYIWRELEDTKNKMASLHEENGVIRKCVASLVFNSSFFTEVAALREIMNSLVVDILTLICSELYFIFKWSCQ